MADHNMERTVATVRYVDEWGTLNTIHVWTIRAVTDDDELTLSDIYGTEESEPYE